MDNLVSKVPLTSGRPVCHRTQRVKTPVKCSMDSQQNVFNHLLNEIQFLQEEVRIKNIIIKSSLMSKSSKHNEKNLGHKTTDDDFLDENFFEFKIHSKMVFPEKVHKTMMPDLIKLA